MEKIFEYEGGGQLSDDPSDPGSLTRWGISQASFPRTDINALTKDDALLIYRRYFWEKLHCDELPVVLAPAVMDTGVNMGVYAAISLLQSALGVHQDGILGPITLGAAKQSNGPSVLKEMLTKRIMRYTTLTTFQNFGLGWVRRALDIHQVCLDYAVRSGAS